MLKSKNIETLWSKAKDLVTGAGFPCFYYYSAPHYYTLHFSRDHYVAPAQVP